MEKEKISDAFKNELLRFKTCFNLDTFPRDVGERGLYESGIRLGGGGDFHTYELHILIKGPCWVIPFSKSSKMWHLHVIWKLYTSRHREISIRKSGVCVV